MTDGQTAQLIDHAADLQRQVDQLSNELIALALALVAIAAVSTVLIWKLWQ